MTISFFKMTGSGNDFVMLDGRVSGPGDWTPERIRAVCSRRTGVGADGLVILSPAGEASDPTAGRQVARVGMDFYNSDGSRAAMCGNAALCSARLAARLGLSSGEMVLSTDAGMFPTRCLESPHMAELNLADFDAPVEAPGISPRPGEALIARATVGVPHLVVMVADLEVADLMLRGCELRHHRGAGPEGEGEGEGANVNFVSRPVNPDDPWPIRTFERGVEGETLACGTGTVAVAAALSDAGLLDLPQEFLTRSGRVLAVRGGHEAGDRDDGKRRPAGGTWTGVWLSGEGRLVYEGTLGPLD